MRALVGFAFVVGLVAVAPVADAKVHDLPVAAVSLDAPKKWAVELDGDQLTVSTKDGAVAISLTHVVGTNFDGAWQGMVEATPQVLGAGAALGAPEDAVFGGMSGKVATASGVLEGQTASMLVALVVTPRRNMLAIVALGADAKGKKYKKDVTKILKSIKARPYKIDDDNFFALAADAQVFAEQVATAIEKNDAKAFIALAEDGFTKYDQNGGMDPYGPSQLKKALKKKKLAKFLELPAKGAWHIAPPLDADPGHFRLYRGESTSMVQVITMSKQSGAWEVSSAQLAANLVQSF